MGAALERGSRLRRFLQSLILSFSLYQFFLLCPLCTKSLLFLSFALPLSLSCVSPLSARVQRERTTREILFYPLPRSNSLGFTGGGDTRHTRGTRSRLAHTLCRRSEPVNDTRFAHRLALDFSLFLALFLYISLSVSLSLSLPLAFDSFQGALHASRTNVPGDEIDRRHVFQRPSERDVLPQTAMSSRAYTLVRENHRGYTPRTRLRTSFDCPGWGARLDVANREQHCSACFSSLPLSLAPSLSLYRSLCLFARPSTSSLPLLFLPKISTVRSTYARGQQ